MSDFDIQQEADAESGRYVLSHDGNTAELTYSVSSPTLRVAIHVGAPMSMRGIGVGHALVKHMVQAARTEGFRIVPQCPFVDAERKKNPSWADAFEV